jgi:hypothetical protein
VNALVADQLATGSGSLLRLRRILLDDRIHALECFERGIVLAGAPRSWPSTAGGAPSPARREPCAVLPGLQRSVGSPMIKGTNEARHPVDIRSLRFAYQSGQIVRAVY